MVQIGMTAHTQSTFKMEYKKIDSDSVEQTFKTKVFKVDLLSEKETIEARLVELEAQLKLLDEK